MKIHLFESDKNLLARNYKQALLSILKSVNVSYKCDFEIASGHLAEILTSFDGSYDLTYELLFILNTKDERVLVISQKGSSFEQFGSSKISGAWGICDESILALDYSEPHQRLANQLHESLHFFSVDDCYDPVTGLALESCDNDECLMRCQVISTTVCNSVLEQLRIFLNE